MRWVRVSLWSVSLRARHIRSHASREATIARTREDRTHDLASVAAAATRLRARRRAQSVGATP